MYLVAGPNGSGKTTLAREIVTDENIIFLNADEIAAELSDSIGIVAGKKLLNCLEQVFQDGQSFVLESTISGNYHVRAIRRARQEKYKIVFIYVFLESVEQNLARIAMRVKLGGHNVQPDDVRRRYRRSLQNFWITKKDISDWDLYYNGGSSFKLVARQESKKLEIINSDLYNKFKEISDD